MEQRLFPVTVTGSRTFASLASGSHHTCGLTLDGLTYCWGQNVNGQLGDGTTIDKSAPVQLADSHTFVSLAAGDYHTCGLTVIGDAYCWGSNWAGQLGDGTSGSGYTSADRFLPVAVSGGRTFTSIVAGGGHTCGLLSSGMALCWGASWQGQQGDGTLGRDHSTPVAVTGGLVYRVLVAGYAHTCGITTGGSLFCWGRNAFGQLGNGHRGEISTSPTAVIGGPPFTKLVAGHDHTCAVASVGSAHCWGLNLFGQIGDGTSGNGDWYSMANRTSPVVPSGGRMFTSIVAGENHTCGLTSPSAVFCWGSNASGQLGDGTVVNRSDPVLVAMPAATPSPTATVANRAGITFTSLSAGYMHTCGVERGTGNAWCWGSNGYGQLGNGSQGVGGDQSADRSLPVLVLGGRRFASLAAGSSHTCGLDTEGIAYCWGYNDSGQLGDITISSRSTPVAVSGGHLFSSLAAGENHTCGVTQNGAAYCWGGNSSGQLGNTNRGEEISPIGVRGGQTFARLVAGVRHTCGIDRGTAWCWGNNTWGQLGNGTSGEGLAAPVAVTGGASFTALAAGSYHTCGLGSGTGKVWCWGWNIMGQLGDGTSVSARSDPAELSGGRTFNSLAAGNSHSCGLSQNGTAYCWGFNGQGQLGDGTFVTNQTAPVAVAGDRTFVSIVAGNFHSCGLASSGTAYCWGHNGQGQLGDGTLDLVPPFGKALPVMVTLGK